MALVNLQIPSAADLYSAFVEKVISLFSAVRDNIYPVGTIYMSTKPTNPSQFIGGTWESIQDRFLVGVGTGHSAGSMGGTVTHRHRLPIGWDGNSGLFAYRKDGDTVPKFGSETVSRGDSFIWSKQWEGRNDWLRIAYDEQANNEPPYLAVYMWMRTA